MLISRSRARPAAIAATPDDSRRGGFTIFRVFSLDAALLYERSELGMVAALYVAAPVAIFLTALFLGAVARPAIGLRGRP